MLQPPLVQPDELLAEVQIRGIRAIQNSEAPLSCHFLSYAPGSMHGSIVVQQYKPLLMGRQQGLHFLYSLWDESLEILTLDGMRENHKRHQLLIRGSGNNMQRLPLLLVVQVFFRTLWQPSIQA
jgi:hypothetical protein